MQAGGQRRFFLSFAGLVVSWAGVFWALAALGSINAAAWVAYQEAWTAGDPQIILRATGESPGLPAFVALFLGPVVALLAGRMSGSGVPVKVETEARPPEPPEAPVGPDPDAVALRLLATLQEEARLLDFVSEDVAGYSDEEVGAAARGVHAGLVRALRDRVRLAPLREEEEGAPVVLEEGFSPVSIRLQGSPTGQAPWQGVLVHPGWIATFVELPRATEGSDPRILAPAEIDVNQG